MSARTLVVAVVLTLPGAALGQCRKTLGPCICVEGDASAVVRAERIDATGTHAVVEAAFNWDGRSVIPALDADGGLRELRAGDPIDDTARPFDRVGAASLAVFRAGNLGWRFEITDAGRVPCPDGPDGGFDGVPVEQAAPAAANSVNCEGALEEAGYREPPCNDVIRRGCSCDASGGGLLGLATLGWLTRRRRY